MQQGHPHPVVWQWSLFCSCSGGRLQRKWTKAVTWWNLPNSPEKIPLERWHLSAWSSMPTAFHTSWPFWSTYCCIFEPTTVSPGSTHISAEVCLDWHILEAWWLDESLILPLSECPLLNVNEGPTKRLMVKLDQRGSECSSSELCHRTSQNWGNTFNPISTLLEARPPQSQKKGNNLHYIASPVGIGQRKCPPERVLTSRKRRQEDLQGI